jgi:hypothetical protein
MKLGSLTILFPATVGIIAMTNTLILIPIVDRSLLDKSCPASAYCEVGQL